MKEPQMKDLQQIHQNSDLILSLRFKTAATVISILVGIVGITVLIGWHLDIQVIKSILPTWTTMKPNIAIGLILSSLSLILLNTKEGNTFCKSLAQIAAILAVTIGTLSLIEHIRDVDFGVNQFLLKIINSDVASPEHSSLTTGVNLVLTGLALIFFNRSIRQFYFSQLFALIVLISCTITLANYVNSTPVEHDNRVALLTACGFFLLGLGVFFANPEKGFMKIVSGSTMGSVALRSFLPAAILIPIILGELQLIGKQAGFFDSEFGVSIVVIASVIILPHFAWLVANQLNRLDAIQQQTLLDLQESQEKYQFLADSIPQLVWTTDVTGEPDYCNKRWVDYTGQSLEQMQKGGWEDTMHPDDLNKTLEVWKKSIKTGINFDLEYRIRNAADDTYHWHLARSSPFRDKNGNVIKWFGTCTNIHEQKKLEEESREREARLNAVNKELEAFSYSVSHDLRAPLRAMDGFSQILEQKYASTFDAEGQRYMKMIRDSAKNMGHLIDDLLALSRLGRQALYKQPVVVKDLVVETVKQLVESEGDRRIETTIGDLPPCQADPGLLKHVFVNLIGNALKYSRKKEISQIEIGYVKRDVEPFYFVKDNGSGFDMQYANKLFSVFQRLHRAEEYEGTGVGLAIVKQVIQRHGGRVWAEAEIDKGATFCFTLEGESQ